MDGTLWGALWAGRVKGPGWRLGYHGKQLRITALYSVLHLEDGNSKGMINELICVWHSKKIAVLLCEKLEAVKPDFQTLLNSGQWQESNTNHTIPHAGQSQYTCCRCAHWDERVPQTEGGFWVSERITFTETKDTNPPGMKGYWLLMHLWKNAHLVKAKICG